MGSSLLEADKVDLARELIQKAKDKGVNLVLPADSLIADKFANDANVDVAANTSIPDGWMGLDLGPDSREAFADIIRDSKTILWNGPMGVFEMSNFSLGTEYVAQAIAEATAGRRLLAHRRRRLGRGRAAAGLRRAGELHQHRRRRAAGVHGRQGAARRHGAGLGPTPDAAAPGLPGGSIVGAEWGTAMQKKFPIASAVGNFL